METAYTEPPWAWQKFGDKYCLTAQHGMREIILSANKGGNIEMNQDGILENIDPNHPNPKLISAAPDLLEACQLVMKSPRGETLTFDVLNKLYEAIYKATK